MFAQPWNFSLSLSFFLSLDFLRKSLKIKLKWKKIPLMASQHQQKIASFIPRDGDKNLFEKRDLVFIKIYKNFQANTWKQHLTLIHYLSIIAHRRYFHSPLYLFPRFYLRDLKRALFLHFAFVSPLSGTSVGLRTIERNVVSETFFPSSSEYTAL